NLVARLSQYPQAGRGYVAEGAQSVLAMNIQLPKSEQDTKQNKLAMDGLKELKNDKAGVENVISKIGQLFTHYLEQGEQQKKQAYQQLKVEFEAKVRQALAQQMGTTPGMKIDVERQPQFQEEWRRLQSQFESQYLKLLDEYRRELTTQR
ncbi:MAG: hypothetical protein WC369_05130, partial [Dehalococcoidales bacterium]